MAPNRPHRNRRATRIAWPLLFSLCLACALGGCGHETADRLGSVGPETHLSAGRSAPAVSTGDGLEAPAGVVEVPLGGGNVRLWPYTGQSFDGVASDPVNLLFIGKADPIAIRDALLALDGNRGAAGFPPVPPFDARWSDAIGDAQTNWATGDGWTGSGIQLALGDYGPLRVHLRLFRTGSTLADGSAWTVGAAHFEVLIPGTADHQVLSWELAEQVVMADLVRSGLLDAATPISTTGPIHAAPTFREIPPFIYNALPAELTGLIGGPAPPVSAGVGIATDGRATVLHLGGRAASAGDRHQRFTMEYDQVVPRPFCADGPADWVHVKGPVTFEKTARVGPQGDYSFDSRYAGRLVATPVDVSQSPPVPIGEPFEASVSETQRGSVSAGGSAVSAISRRLVPGSGGTEFVTQQLRVGTDGAKRFDVHTRCR